MLTLCRIKLSYVNHTTKPFPIRLKTYPKAGWIDSKKFCSPCFLHGHKPCPQAGADKYSPCYDELETIFVIDSFEQFLKEKG